MSERARDYALSDADAQYLQAIALLPVAERFELLDRYLGEHGPAALVALFAHFVGLANSVVANNREMVELTLICEGEWYPEMAEQINLPTIFGALNGVPLANAVRQGKTCEGCAFRRGTPANQSPITTIDAAWCPDNGERFLCHERGLDAGGNPTQLCVGHAQHIVTVRRGHGDNLPHPSYEGEVS